MMILVVRVGIGTEQAVPYYSAIGPGILFIVLGNYMGQGHQKLDRWCPDTVDTRERRNLVSRQSPGWLANSVGRICGHHFCRSRLRD